jgi:myo-inositol-1(or 4)-monophosphatase
MTNAHITERFEFAADLIREAGALAARYFQNIGALTIESKGPQDMVSEADLNVELLIRERLKQRFPADAFFGEETGAQAIEAAVANSAGIWVVDPIDGTQPFISGLPDWCISVGFIIGNRLQIGLVYAPIPNELFAAQRGCGATLNGQPIRVKGNTIKDGVVSVGYSMRLPPNATLTILRNLLEGGGKFHRNGSAALSLCYVACGRLLAYIEPHVNSWDCLAALVIISEAGGQINDFLVGDGLLKGNRIVAASPVIYAQVEKLFEPTA